MWSPMAAEIPSLSSAQTERMEAMRQAGALAEQGAAHLQTAFPAWRVVAGGLVGSVDAPSRWK